MSPSPPRLARRIIGWVLPDDVQASIDGDLVELFEARVARRGQVRARLWYWTETLSFVVRFGFDRTQRFLNWLLRGDAPSGLDFKLGGRMLLKHPGLAIIGGFGMAIAVAIGAGAYAFFTIYLHPPLPLHEGDRVVAIVNVAHGPAPGDPRRVARDFGSWRQLRSVVDVSAFRTTFRELSGERGPARRVAVAEMSASGFRVARVAPLLGRVLIPADETPGAPSVVVLGHEQWQEQFAGDSTAVGQTLRLNGVAHTVVGVMPKDFAFPIRHGYWVPLRLDPVAYEPGTGPPLDVFGRLAPGVSRSQAQAELTTIGQRAAVAHPASHAYLRPRIARYTSLFTGDAEIPPWVMTLISLAFTLVMVLVCANVAILVYARTATRAAEIAIRTALGATRTRVVAQLFAEALVLSGLASLFGLAIVSLAMRHLDDLVDTRMGGAPFWFVPGLSISAVLYTAGLALLGALIVGVLPALRATGRRLQSALGRLSGGARPQLGRTWTVLIVAQVAITVAALPPALYVGAMMLRQGIQTVRLPAEFLYTRPAIVRENAPTSAGERAAASIADARSKVLELVRQAEREPAVAALTFTDAMPGEEGIARFDVADGSATPRTRSVRVGTEYMALFGVRSLAGRGFTRDDTAGSGRPAIVNRTFAEEVFGSVGAAVGRRIRQARWSDSMPVAPWSEIVGVVENFPSVGFGDPGDPTAKAYFPMARGEADDAALIVRLEGATVNAFATRLTSIANSIDANLRLREMQSLDSHYRALQDSLVLAALALLAVLSSVLLLSAGGVYAMMSFTVTQRRREIGVRAALGAGSVRILTAVLAQAGRQLGLGVAVGFAVVLLLDVTVAEFFFSTRPWLVPGVALVVLAVGLFAAWGPARRILSIQPTESLRAD
jgi:putative ABC transport system permease protein